MVIYTVCVGVPYIHYTLVCVSTDSSAASSNTSANAAAKQNKNPTINPKPVTLIADISAFILNKDKIKSAVTDEKFALLQEIQEYLTKVDCSWAPGRMHAQVIGSY